MFVQVTKRAHFIITVRQYCWDFSMNFIEVIQDGAVLVNRTNALGAYTRNIASCVAYAFYGENWLALVHDTGQLSVPSIINTIGRFGVVRKAYSVQNPQMELRAQTRAHRERRKRIFGGLRIKANPIKVQTDSGDVYFTNDGEHGTILHSVSASLSSIPDRERRLCVNELNNLFAPRNAQSLPVDLQFVDGSYTSNPELLNPVEEMEHRVELELRRGDRDYLLYFQKARGLGIV